MHGIHSCDAETTFVMLIPTHWYLLDANSLPFHNVNKLTTLNVMNISLIYIIDFLLAQLSVMVSFPGSIRCTRYLQVYNIVCLHVSNGHRLLYYVSWGWLAPPRPWCIPIGFSILLSYVARILTIWQHTPLTVQCTHPTYGVKTHTNPTQLRAYIHAQAHTEKETCQFTAVYARCACPINCMPFSDCFLLIHWFFVHRRSRSWIRKTKGMAVYQRCASLRSVLQFNHVWISEKEKHHRGWCWHEHTGFRWYKKQISSPMKTNSWVPRSKNGGRGAEKKAQWGGHRGWWAKHESGAKGNCQSWVALVLF